MQSKNEYVSTKTLLMLSLIILFHLVYYLPIRLFQLKNPWSHLRWKGNYSEYDINNWTNDLKNALNYDPNLACNVDNGIFWIDYESLMRFFDVFYLRYIVIVFLFSLKLFIILYYKSWNPNLFQYTN